MTSHAIKGSDIFIRALENEGVEYVFGVPGERETWTSKSFRTSRIKVVVTRHEQVAGFMAATYENTVNRSALSTAGPGTQSRYNPRTAFNSTGAP